MDPQQLLERGFVMVADENGRPMVSVEDIPPEGKMKLFMKDGVVELDFVVRKIFEK
jgi:exonuclease VII large subunit